MGIHRQRIQRCVSGMSKKLYSPSHGWRSSVEAQEGIRTYLIKQIGRVADALRHLERSLRPHDPLVAVIRREGVVEDGLYRVHYVVTLFGDNPVALEDFGPLRERGIDPLPPLPRDAEEAVRPYRYFIEFRQHFASDEEARRFWIEQGAIAFRHG